MSVGSARATCQAHIRATREGTGSVEDASRALGFSRAKGYDLIRSGQFPCRVLRIGRKTRVVRASLLRVLESGDPEYNDARIDTTRCPRPVMMRPRRESGGASSSHGAATSPVTRLSPATSTPLPPRVRRVPPGSSLLPPPAVAGASRPASPSSSDPVSPTPSGAEHRGPV
ncbi:helix-turn-helix domain-containing protein [Streptomyces flaveolus]|uniref:helix-turn-helix domain-containing protein n=1 Tax=Streptomyces flaveolus TaxID=67297 RepID=UPI0037F5679F